MAGHYWTGRGYRLGDHYRTGRLSRASAAMSAAKLEECGRELDSHMAVLDANTQLADAERATQDHLRRQALYRLADVQPAMRGRDDGRTKAKRTPKREWKASRKNKLIPSEKGMKRSR